MNIMCEYLELHYTLAEHQAEIKRLTEAAKQCSERMYTLRHQIEKSVHPVCGSATKPVIRTFTNGRYQTLSVFWDSNLNRGRITITENNEEEV